MTQGPRFWYQTPGAALRRVGPLAPGRCPPAAARIVSSVPVISVRNLSLYGTGKTPTVIALAQRLALLGHAVQVVTSGPRGPARVDEQADDPAEIGDKALLMAAFAPTWIAADAAAGVRAAEKAGAGIIVVDGGVRSAKAPKFLRIVVEDAVQGLGNGFAWPLGPMRRPFDPAHPEADLIITIGPQKAQEVFRQRWGERLGCPHAAAHLAPLETGMDWRGQDVVAFAGIGAPERFFATLRGLGANLVTTHALDDHQDFTPALLLRLGNEARARGAQLVTTEKDAVRLPPAFRSQVVSLPVRLELDDWRLFDRLVPQPSPS